jgi:hypothetical protein
METIVNASYIVEALGKFLKILRKKRPEMAAGDTVPLGQCSGSHRCHGDGLDVGQADQTD